jgi:hypothetical protein
VVYFYKDPISIDLYLLLLLKTTKDVDVLCAAVVFNAKVG